MLTPAGGSVAGRAAPDAAQAGGPSCTPARAVWDVSHSGSGLRGAPPLLPLRLAPLPVHVRPTSPAELEASSPPASPLRRWAGPDRQFHVGPACALRVAVRFAPGGPVLGWVSGDGRVVPLPEEPPGLPADPEPVGRDDSPSRGPGPPTIIRVTQSRRASSSGSGMNTGGAPVTAEPPLPEAAAALCATMAQVGSPRALEAGTRAAVQLLALIQTSVLRDAERMRAAAAAAAAAGSAKDAGPAASGGRGGCEMPGQAAVETALRCGGLAAAAALFRALEPAAAAPAGPGGPARGPPAGAADSDSEGADAAAAAPAESEPEMTPRGASETAEGDLPAWALVGRLARSLTDLSDEAALEATRSRAARAGEAVGLTARAIEALIASDCPWRAGYGLSAAGAFGRCDRLKPEVVAPRLVGLTQALAGDLAAAAAAAAARVPVTPGAVALNCLPTLLSCSTREALACYLRAGLATPLMAIIESMSDYSGPVPLLPRAKAANCLNALLEAEEEGAAPSGSGSSCSAGAGGSGVSAGGGGGRLGIAGAILARPALRGGLLGLLRALPACFSLPSCQPACVELLSRAARAAGADACAQMPVVQELVALLREEDAFEQTRAAAAEVLTFIAPKAATEVAWALAAELLDAVAPEAGACVCSSSLSSSHCHSSDAAADADAAVRDNSGRDRDAPGGGAGPVASYAELAAGPLAELARSRELRPIVLERLAAVLRGLHTAGRRRSLELLIVAVPPAPGAQAGAPSLPSSRRQSVEPVGPTTPRAASRFRPASAAGQDGPAPMCLRSDSPACGGPGAFCGALRRLSATSPLGVGSFNSSSAPAADWTPAQARAACLALFRIAGRPGTKADMAAAGVPGLLLFVMLDCAPLAPRAAAAARPAPEPEAYDDDDADADSDGVWYHTRGPGGPLLSVADAAHADAVGADAAEATADPEAADAAAAAAGTAAVAVQALLRLVTEPSVKRQLVSAGAPAAVDALLARVAPAWPGRKAVVTLRHHLTAAGGPGGAAGSCMTPRTSLSVETSAGRAGFQVGGPAGRDCPGGSGGGSSPAHSMKRATSVPAAIHALLMVPKAHDASGALGRPGPPPPSPRLALLRNGADAGVRVCEARAPPLGGAEAHA